MQNFRILVNRRVVSLTAVTARQACIEALKMEPSATRASILIGASGRHVAATMSREELDSISLAAKVSGEKVTFSDRYQAVTIHCRSEAHAMQVARALNAGAVKFTSKAE